MKLDDGYCPRDCLCDGCRFQRARAEWAGKRIDRPFLIDGRRIPYFDNAWLDAENLRALAEMKADMNDNIARALRIPVDAYDVSLGLSLTPDDARLLRALKIDPWK